MIQRLQGKVTRITLIENVGESLDLCEIQIDFDVLKIFYDYNELMEYQNCDVSYTTRKDVVKGVEDLVVCELVKLATIQTVASVENIRLIPEGNKRPLCNFDVKGARYGNYYPNITAIMAGYQLGSSPKARWFDCTLIDMYSREFVVRKFEPEGELDDVEDKYKKAVGHYVVMDVESTRYGYQTKDIDVLPQDVELSPEVEVAKSVLENVIAGDPGLQEYCTRFDFINNMMSVIDGEPGYALVRMASELYMINAVENISTDMEVQAMRRAVICSRGYMLPHKVEYSVPLLNSTKIMTCQTLKADKELMLIIDALSRETASSTKLMYIKIRGLVNDIINIRRGIEDEEAIDNISTFGAAFNGLL